MVLSPSDADDAAAGGGGRCRGGGSLCSQTPPVPSGLLRPAGGVRAQRQHRGHLVLRWARRDGRQRTADSQQHVQKPAVCNWVLSPVFLLLLHISQGDIVLLLHYIYLTTSRQYKIWVLCLLHSSTHCRLWTTETALIKHKQMDQ